MNNNERDIYLDGHNKGYLEGYTAGEVAGFKRGLEMQEPYLAGIREVVEFVESEGVMYQYSDTLARWQAKLREWGINE